MKIIICLAVCRTNHSIVPFYETIIHSGLKALLLLLLLLITSVMSDSVRPQKWQPTRLPRPWDSPGKNTGVGCHFLLQCMTVKSERKSLSRVRLLATPWTATHQAAASMGFSRQECWSGVTLPSPKEASSLPKRVLRSEHSSIWLWRTEKNLSKALPRWSDW